MDSRAAIITHHHVRRRRVGFTLLEVLVATVFVAFAVAAVIGAIGAQIKVQSKAADAVLLQRLANEKLNDLRLLQDPSMSTGNGDFSDRAYPDITWTADVETTSTTNLDQVTVTATNGADSQSITTMMYVVPTTDTTTTTTTTQ